MNIERVNSLEDGIKSWYFYKEKYSIIVDEYPITIQYNSPWQVSINLIHSGVSIRITASSIISRKEAFKNLRKKIMLYKTFPDVKSYDL